jgi:uncharacterized membrane protein (UPF0127 family)
VANKAAFLILAVNLSVFLPCCGIEETLPVRFPDGRVVTCEIADTPKKMEVGLSTYGSLSPDRGMIFIYARPRTGVGFWMPNKMKFQIDMIFVGSDKRIAMIEPRVPICESDLMQDCPSYGPPEAEVQYVVEVVAGLCGQMGLKVGDQLDFKLP